MIRIAQAGLVQAKWTDAILDGTFRSLRANRPDLDPPRLDRTRLLMNQAVRDCLVTGFEPLIRAVTALPDPNDRHVARHRDQFLMDQFHLDPVSMHKAVQAIADSWTAPPGTVSDVLDALERSGIVETAAILRR